MKATQTNAANQIDQTVAEIAAKYLDIESLVPQGSDSLDFHDLSVETIKRALEAAYEAGLAAR